MLSSLRAAGGSRGTCVQAVLAAAVMRGLIQHFIAACGEQKPGMVGSPVGFWWWMVPHRPRIAIDITRLLSRALSGVRSPSMPSSSGKRCLSLLE